MVEDEVREGGVVISYRVLRGVKEFVFTFSEMGSF